MLCQSWLHTRFGTFRLWKLGLWGFSLGSVVAPQSDSRMILPGHGKRGFLFCFICLFWVFFFFSLSTLSIFFFFPSAEGTETCKRRLVSINKYSKVWNELKTVYPVRPLNFASTGIRFYVLKMS